jgi:hypothetical protein
MYTDLSSAGMVVEFPKYPLARGDEFTVDINANTNGQALDVWLLKVTYDKNVLEVSGTATSSLFRTAIVNDNKAAGTVLMTTGGLNSGVENEDVTGSSVAVATVSFKVLSDVVVGTHSNVISLLVNDMVNVNTIKFVDDVALRL